MKTFIYLCCHYDIMIDDKDRELIEVLRENSRLKTKDISNDWFILKLKNKVNNLLPALYYALVYYNDDSSREIFKELFGNYPYGKDDLMRIVKEIGRLSDKLEGYETQDESPSLQFSEIIPMIEDSRNMPVDRNISLWDFKQIYDRELQKWQQKT